MKFAESISRELDSDDRPYRIIRMNFLMSSKMKGSLLSVSEGPVRSVSGEGRSWRAVLIA